MTSILPPSTNSTSRLICFGYRHYDLTGLPGHDILLNFLGQLKIFMKVIRKMTNFVRTSVPPEMKPWTTSYPDYKPKPWKVDLSGKSWADPDIGTPGFNPAFNCVDGLVDRTSYEGKYLVENGYPLNPRGRTGANLRGKLGKWGPNHAADPIVTKWKRNGDGHKIRDPVSGKYILSFVAIERGDTGEWAIPGGNVDPGETPEAAARREFQEEALDSTTRKLSCEIVEVLRLLFSRGVEVYRGINDSDYRNTDNAWMETVAVNYHDGEGQWAEGLPLQAGDDAKKVAWKDIDRNLPLFSSHSIFIKLVADRHDAHW